MNVTALARKLKMPTKELLEMLPEMGFDIGKKAIKINDNEAHKIVKNWRFLLAKYRREKAEKIAEEKEVTEVKEKKIIHIGDFISVKDLAIKSEIPVTTIIAQIMKSGSLVSMNEKIDFATAHIIGEDLGVEVILQTDSDEQKEVDSQTQSIEEKQKGGLSRPPVIVIMGHVDHGKTKLLDTIRKTNVIGQESGGITQHIGAYQIEKKGKKITFIDTPGHEAFTTMRSRGAKIADIAILIIAADDGIKPQTKESIKIIKSGKLPMVVAINKIDKPNANIEKVKQELSAENLLPEDWGGKTITVPISAIKGDGIDELLETLLLVADMEKENITADPKTKATATIIESHTDKGEGPVATALVQNGTLNQGDLLFFDTAQYGKVRALKDFTGQSVTKAPPSMPVKILGLKGLPSVGDILTVQDKSTRKNTLKNYEIKTQGADVYTPQKKSNSNKDISDVNLIIRADVLGSLEAIISSLNKITHPEIHINIIGKGLGHVTENDILLSNNHDAHILAFHATPTSSAITLSQEKNVEVHSFKVIYELIDFVREQTKKMLSPEITKTSLGKVEILKVFKKDQKSMVVGGMVTHGRAVNEKKATVLREDIEIGKGKIVELQAGKVVAKDVEKGNECGLKFEGPQIIEVGDILEMYDEVVREKKLS